MSENPLCFLHSIGGMVVEALPFGRSNTKTCSWGRNCRV